MRTDLQCYARLLHLIAHYELGNSSLLEFLFKSVYRFMAKMENLSLAEEEIFRFLRRSFRISNQSLRPEFESLLEEFDPKPRDLADILKGALLMRIAAFDLRNALVGVRTEEEWRSVIDAFYAA